MFYNSTTKSGKNSTSPDSDSTQNRTIVPYPGVTPIDAPPTSHDRLVKLLNSLNPHPPIDAIMDIIYEQVFGMDAYLLRLYLKLPDTISLRDALQRRSPVGYQLLCLCEEMMASDIAYQMEKRGGDYMTGTDMNHRAIAWSEAFKAHAENLRDGLKLNLATGERLRTVDDDDPF